MIPFFPTADRESKPAMIPRPQPGNGVRARVTPTGWSLSAPAASRLFRHPFRPLLGANQVRFSLGLVDGMWEPKIGGVPISGDANGAVPALKLLPNVANENGESWACLEVEPDEKGELNSQTRIEIVHSNQPVSLDPAVGRLALAMIIWNGAIASAAFAIVHFNVRYYRRVSPPGGGPVRHFFF